MFPFHNNVQKCDVQDDVIIKQTEDIIVIRHMEVIVILPETFDHLMKFNEIILIYSFIYHIDKRELGIDSSKRNDH